MRRIAIGIRTMELSTSQKLSVVAVMSGAVADAFAHYQSAEVPFNA